MTTLGSVAVECSLQFHGCFHCTFCVLNFFVTGVLRTNKRPKSWSPVTCMHSSSLCHMTHLLKVAIGSIKTVVFPRKAIVDGPHTSNCPFIMLLRPE